MATKNVNAAVARLHDSDDYTDLTIMCRGHTIKMHKNIVCSQSDFLRKAVTDGHWLEGRTNTISMDAYTPAAIRAMKEFFYKGDYTCVASSSAEDSVMPGSQIYNNHMYGSDHGATEGEDKHAPSTMPAHLDVFDLADKIFSKDLKQLAEKNFTAVVTKSWQSEHFADAITKVYEITPDGPEGATLRSTVVNIAAKHIRQLRAENKAFDEVLSSEAAFDKDLIIAMLAKDTPDDIPRGNAYQCRGCQKTWDYMADAAWPSRHCPFDLCTIGGVQPCPPSSPASALYSCPRCPMRLKACLVPDTTKLYCATCLQFVPIESWGKQSIPA